MARARAPAPGQPGSLPPPAGRAAGVNGVRVACHRAHPVDSPGQRELRRAEPLHEVAAAALAGLLHRPQHGVDRGEAARYPLGRDGPLGEDAVPLKQGERKRMRPHGGRCSVRSVAAGDPVRQQRPAATRGGRPGPRRHRRPPRPPAVAAAVPAGPPLGGPRVEHAGHRGALPCSAQPGRSAPPAGSAQPGRSAQPARSALPEGRRAARRRRPSDRRAAAGRHHPQRCQRVVGQQPRPDEVPHRRDQVAVVHRVAVSRRGHPVAEHPEEQPAASGERGQHRCVQRRHGQLARLGQEQWG